MRLLIDENLPRPIKNEFSSHEVSTVPEMGWSGKKNGELLQLMADNGFEALVTVDQNLRHPQNLKAVGVAVVVLVAPTNRLDDLIPLLPAAEYALSTIQPGDVVEVTP